MVAALHEVLVNPGYPIATGYMTPWAHLTLNLLLLLPAGLALERAVGPVPVAVAALAGTLALDAWILTAGWTGYIGGSSGAVFGVFGAAVGAGVLANGRRRWFALESLAGVMMFMYLRQGSAAAPFHLAAVGAGVLTVVAMLRASGSIRSGRRGPSPDGLLTRRLRRRGSPTSPAPLSPRGPGCR